MAITRLDSRTIEVDDAHPFVFTSGSWRQITIEGLFNNTASSSSDAGDRKVVRFVGTSITVLGGLQQYSGNGLTKNPPLSAFSVDDGPSVTYSAPSPPFYTAVSYYQSSELTMGEHVLTMRNTIDNDIVHIDGFIIQAPESQVPQILPSDGSSVPVAFPVSPSSKGIITTPGLSSSSIPSLGAISTAPNSNVSSQSSSTPGVTQPQVPVPSRTLQRLPSPTDTNDHISTKHPKNIFIIASCTGGGLLVMVLVVVWIKCHKHRKKLQTSLQPFIQRPQEPINPPQYKTGRFLAVPATDVKLQLPEIHQSSTDILLDPAAPLAAGNVNNLISGIDETQPARGRCEPATHSSNISVQESQASSGPPAYEP